LLAAEEGINRGAREAAGWFRTCRGNSKPEDLCDDNRRFHIPVL